MALVIVLLLLVLLTGGVGFTGVVALGAFAIAVKILFFLLLFGLLLSVVRAIGGSSRGPYDPLV